MAIMGMQPTVALDEIVVATDFTPASDVATAYGLALAKHFSANLTMAHVVDLSVGARSGDALLGIPLDEIRHESAENMERTMIQFRGAGIRVREQMLEAHKPAAAIVRMCEEQDTDLLILGTYGRRGLSKYVLGSFAEGVIHHARCPVLTVGPNVKAPAGNNLTFHKVLFATDLEHNTAEKAAIAIAFAQESLATITLCHVIKDAGKTITESLERSLKSEATLRRLIPGAAYEWCDTGCDVEYGDAADHILKLARKMEADLIVLGARRSPTWFTRVVQGVAFQVIGQATCPVMTICSD